MRHAVTEAAHPLSGPLRAARRQRWEQDCDYLLARYLDNHESVEALKEQLRRLYPNNAHAMLDNLLTLNLLRRLVDTRAKLYRKAPARRLIDARSAFWVTLDAGEGCDGRPLRVAFARIEDAQALARSQGVKVSNFSWEVRRAWEESL